MQKGYHTLILAIKLLTGFSLLLLDWCLCWWLYLVYLSTENIFVGFLMILNILLVSYYLWWNLGNYSYRNNLFSQIFSILVCLALIYLACSVNWSSLWVFEDLTNILSHFTGTISYMFNITRQSAEVLKIIGNVGVGILIIWLVMASYIWSLDFYERFLIHDM